MFSEEERRTKPTKVLKSLVFHRDKGNCRLCGLPVDPLDFDIGHNTAFAKGGKLNLQNALLLHPRCNRSMQKLNLKEAKNVLGLPDSAQDQAKKILKTLSTTQLRYLAKTNFVKLKSKVEQGWFSDRTIRPTRLQYINALAKVLSADDVKAKIASMPKPERKQRQPKKKRSFWSF